MLQCGRFYIGNHLNKNVIFNNISLHFVIYILNKFKHAKICFFWHCDPWTRNNHWYVTTSLRFIVVMIYIPTWYVFSDISGIWKRICITMNKYKMQYIVVINIIHKRFFFTLLIFYFLTACDWKCHHKISLTSWS